MCVLVLWTKVALALKGLNKSDFPIVLLIQAWTKPVSSYIKSKEFLKP